MVSCAKLLKQDRYSLQHYAMFPNAFSSYSNIYGCSSAGDWVENKREEIHVLAYKDQYIGHNYP